MAKLKFSQLSTKWNMSDCRLPIARYVFLAQDEHDTPDLPSCLASGSSGVTLSSDMPTRLGPAFFAASNCFCRSSWQSPP